MHRQRTPKLGLSLSGGGFRAALFHLGVLAQMADQGLLRHVEVISTVSGGAIIGSLYYLHLKKLLEAKPDDQITDDDYRDIVRTLVDDFLAGVQKNLRMRTFANALKNWRMRRPDYSRSDRMGELYDKYFFRPAIGSRRKHPVRMRELKIIPCGADPRFHPRRDNVGRKAKVPILLVNATSLNTGRNWRFEATRMGEPPRTGRIADEVDKVTRLVRPPDYDRLPESIAEVRLGIAVASSTVVPALFVPVPISNLYPNRRIELVDGGIHDNQGIQGLLDEGCRCIIISDASGQMDEAENPDTSVASVLTRTNAVLMHRLREEQLTRALTLPHADVCLIHMRQGLAPAVVPWVGEKQDVQDPAPDRTHAEGRGIDKGVQERLSRVRTDLDSFTEIEAFSLMQLGYTLSGNALREKPALAGLLRPRPRSDWPFQVILPWMKRPTKDYLRHLDVAAGRLFKVFRLQPRLHTAFVLALTACLVLCVYLSRDWLTRPRLLQWQWWQVFAVAAGAAAGLVVRSAPLRHALQWPHKPLAWLYRFGSQVFLSVLAAPFIQLYLATFDRLFLAQGQVRKLKPPPGYGRRRISLRKHAADT